MKKNLLLVAFAAILGCTMAYAQPRAIGGRLGYGIEFSYEHGFGDKNMLSIDAGLGFSGVSANYKNAGVGAGLGWGPSVAVTYDWINPFGASFDKVWDGKGEWNWYMGVGAGANLGFGRFVGTIGDTSLTYSKFFTTGLGAVGRVGVEYNFWFPLQLSVDWRPIIGPQLTWADGNFCDPQFYTSGLFGIAGSVRYRF